MLWVQDRASHLWVHGGKLFLGKDFIYSSGECVCSTGCRAPWSGSSVCACVC